MKYLTMILLFLSACSVKPSRQISFGRPPFSAVLRKSKDIKQNAKSGALEFCDEDENTQITYCQDGVSK